MKRLLVICEGQCEEEFVNDNLAPHLREFGLWVYPALLKDDIGRRGGGSVSVDRVARHIRNEYWNFDFITTLLDFYGFERKAGRSRAEIETAILDGVRLLLIVGTDLGHVLPYVQMHEFEALLFSDTTKFEIHLDWTPKASESLDQIRRAFATPEHIDDSPHSAPSKRLAQVFPGYDREKLLYGPLIAQDIGIAAIRAQCPGFNAWLTRLEALGPD